MQLPTLVQATPVSVVSWPPGAGGLPATVSSLAAGHSGRSAASDALAPTERPPARSSPRTTSDQRLSTITAPSTSPVEAPSTRLGARPAYTSTGSSDQVFRGPPGVRAARGSSGQPSNSSRRSACLIRRCVVVVNLDGRRQLNLELGGVVDVRDSVLEREVEHVTAAGAVVGRKMQMPSDHLDPVERVRKAEPDHRPGHTAQVADVLLRECLGESRVRASLLRDGTNADVIEAASDPHRGWRRHVLEAVPERLAEIGVTQ